MGKDRKAPEEPANEFNIGSRKKGLDGEWWVVHKTASGIKRWNRYISKASQTQQSSNKTKTSATNSTTASTKTKKSATPKAPAKSITISRFDIKAFP